ncbi:Uncharacterised protein [Sphingobacterium mizutaii]|uniref:Uncharacterized protein n=1 Tax=Sphingobacterium mizutaii TaxID=1010 RepID=A0AAJ4XCE3_9SPHI|nr:hypothetical protein SAMN05192578_10217 [Sphingobacterium mizutaii]SNV52754.1 Uncharacterised protein [Sphingobacterium mizutaii]
MFVHSYRFMFLARREASSRLESVKNQGSQDRNKEVLNQMLWRKYLCSNIVYFFMTFILQFYVFFIKLLNH